jgi:3-hydroxy-9,10-secoandrosta-1,3,5(10)-triene-9,17-dione monooxygenase reductase component
VSIHTSDPFATPEPARSPVRRLRGRLPAPVTLWTAADGSGRWAGLTVSSALVVDGDPGRLLGVVDEESTLWEVLGGVDRFAVTVLGERDRLLADVFAGQMPAPGGPFVGRDWRPTAYGPVLEGADTWAGCRRTGVRPVGWGLLIEAVIDTVELAATQAPPLVHHRGRYGTPSRAGRSDG